MNDIFDEAVANRNKWIKMSDKTKFMIDINGNVNFCIDGNHVCYENQESKTKVCIHEPIFETHEVFYNRANAECIKCGEQITMAWNSKLTTNWHIAKGQK